MTLLLSVVLWLVDAWKFWQKAHMSHPPGVKWWWQSAWCLLELCVVHCEALWPSPCSPKLLGRYSFLFWKNRIRTGTYQVSKDALWKSGLFPTCMSHPCKVLQHATCMVWRERGYHVSGGRGWAKPQVHSLSFPLYRLCFAVCVCLTTQGNVRTCNDSRGLFVSGPLLCSRSTTGRSVRYLLRVPHKKKEPRGAEKHPQASSRRGSRRNLKSPKMRCRLLKGSWEDWWALNQYACSLVHRTSHRHDSSYGVMVLN